VCAISSSGTVNLYHYYNTGYSSSYLQSSNKAIGFSTIITSFSNGVAMCSFTRDNYLSNVNNYFDLSGQYHILTAYGSLSGSGIIVRE